MSLARGSFRYGEDTISYRVRITDRRSHRISIHVEPDGRVLVDAPPEASSEAIRNAIAKRGRWIWKHWGAARQRRENVSPREYVSGETFFYLGRRYRLKVLVKADGAAKVTLRGAFIEVRVAERNPAVVRAALADWYRQRAREVFAVRLERLRLTMRWPQTAPPTRLRTMHRQWGSCSSAGTLTLNPHLVRAPAQCIDYVLLHELCHLKVHDHGPRFYRLLEKHMPDWQKVKTRLDEMAEQLLSN